LSKWGVNCHVTGNAAISHELVAHAHALLDTICYLTLGTADADGEPWTAPVYFAPAQGWRFYWVSATDARHSRNIAERPQVSLVVFDSTVAPYHGRAVYALGRARELTDDEIDEGLKAYPGPSRRGASPMTRDEVASSTGYRLYQATASEVWVLCPREPGQPCPLHGLARDHRARVG
jgi:nitroimidazol reductase NimA-like FMN-containing flavoprotein (pyridoxamine 5'-phosphate oxidase superfamily)